ncbi:unnamed protein product [Symbiodinium natans]|uniref:Altered inheritance of mitochondria protein 24, mitochondrial n=1 Tax=Symbiodinium natans TaxID=878477 RepID=A0A812KRM9_9DINO|nr:unnamed protein product [Symbiodinium natans]
MADFEVLRGASASALRVRLQGTAAVNAESDALVSKTHNVEVCASLGSGLGGLLGGVARSLLTNESFFLQTLQCKGGSGEVLVAPEDQGDIAIVQLPGPNLSAVLVTSGAFLCAETGIDTSTRVQRASQGLFSGSGFFLMRCSGHGKLAMSCFGSCVRYDLQPGECREVDNGHLVAWGESVSYSGTLLGICVFACFVGVIVIVFLAVLFASDQPQLEPRRRSRRLSDEF